MAATGYPSEADELQQQVKQLREERERWLEEKANLLDELETLRSRVQKFAQAAAQATAAKADVPRSDATCQTEAIAADLSALASSPQLADAAGRGEQREFSSVELMLESPKDEAVQLKGIEALFAQQTQVDGGRAGAAAPTLQASLEATVAVFGNHAGNYHLQLKACQLLSVLLAEPGAKQQVPLTLLWRAAQAVVATSTGIIADVASGGSYEAVAGSPSPLKLLTWSLSLFALLLPSLGAALQIQEQGGALVNDLLARAVSKLLQSPELSQQESLALKCVQLLPLLPMEPWVQKACLDSGTVHALALTLMRLRRVAAASGVKADLEAPLPKAIQVAVRGVFADNLELCVKAIDDTFVSDAFVCLEVLGHLQGMERRRRGTLRDLDKDHGIIPKAIGLWTYHQRAALEAEDPQTSPSREVLQKVSELLQQVTLKLPQQVLLQRMKEYENSEVLQRLCLAAIHNSAQLRLQVAVSYADNGVVPAMVSCMQKLLQGLYAGKTTNGSGEIVTVFTLLQDENLPADAWQYIVYCLEVCQHVLSHWSATKLSLQKADIMDARAAPLLLAQAGLVDCLAEILDPKNSDVEFREPPPGPVAKRAADALQALFEQNGHICLFCMKHYTEVKLIISLGCESLIIDPLAEFPDLQKQAVEQMMESFDKFSATDERLGRKILKALSGLFESSYHLVAWFLAKTPLSGLGEYQSADVHVEAVRAVARAPYWSAEDAPLLPEFVAQLGTLLLDSIEGLTEEPTAAGAPGPPAPSSKKRPLDLTEAEELVSVCMSSVLHLLLIDPSPPTVLRVLSRTLSRHGQEAAPGGSTNDGPAAGDGGDEGAVNAVMRVMQVFGSSERVQMNCQHLLTSLLGE